MIRVEGLTLERFLNLAAEQGVGVRRAKRVSYTVLRAQVSARGWHRLRRVVPEKYAVTVERQGGLPYLFRRLTLRTALLAGLVLVAAGVLAASMFVWEVRVEGLDTREAMALKDELAGMGIYPGAWKGEIDEEQAGIRVLVGHEEIAWVDIRLQGVVALVEVVTAEVAPEIYDENTPQNIIATKDAIIERVVPMAGEAKVKQGDTVRAGDVLISGLVWDEGKPRMLFAARGETVGSVWYQGGASGSVWEEARIPTGQTYTQRFIALGGDVSAVEPDCGFAEYDAVLKDTVDIGLFLPVTISEWEYSEVKLIQQPREFEALCVALEEQAYFDAMRFVPEDAEVVGHHAIYRLEDGVLSVTVYVHTYEDIGRAEILEDS